MDHPRTKNYQKKYRQQQKLNGLERFELLVCAKTKAQFEALVTATAQDYPEHWDLRRRKVKARTQLFDKLTQSMRHEFIALTDQITELKAEINALAPQFFQTKHPNKTPLPEAIAALPDDPKALKTLLAQTYQENQHTKRELAKYQRLAQQYEELYNVATRYNEELKAKTNSLDEI